MFPSCSPHVPLVPLTGFQHDIPQSSLRRGMRLAHAAQELACEPLFEDLHDSGRIPLLGLADEQVEVFGHDHITHDDEPIFAADFFEDLQEEIAASRGSPPFENREGCRDSLSEKQLPFTRNTRSRHNRSMTGPGEVWFPNDLQQ